MSNLFYKVLGETLQTTRVQRVLTQQDVADRLHISRSTITSWELGRRTISMDDLIKYCDILNVDPNEIIKPARKYLYK